MGLLVNNRSSVSRVSLWSAAIVFALIAVLPIAAAPQSASAAINASGLTASAYDDWCDDPANADVCDDSGYDDGNGDWDSGDQSTDPGPNCDYAIDASCEPDCDVDAGEVCDPECDPLQDECEDPQDNTGFPPPPMWPKTPNGAIARIASNGRTAIAPNRAPRLVKRMIKAANKITRKPYKWGGGHARLNDRGYDCSGAVSYVLRSVGLVRGSLVSGGYKTWGVNGAGRWINVYANKGHVFIVIAGLRFDTSGKGQHGPRWRAETRSTRGFKLRHPRGY